MIQELIGRPATLWYLIQAPLQEVLDDVGLDVGVEARIVRLFCLDRIYDLLLRVADEGVRGSEHDVREDSEGPRINLLVIGIVREYFRRHVQLCTELHRGHMVLLKYASKSKISQLAD